MFFVLIHFMPTRLVYEHNALGLQAPTHSSPPLGFFWPGIKYCGLVDQSYFYQLHCYNLGNISKSFCTIWSLMNAHPSLMLHSPASYIKLEEAMTKEHHDTDLALINDAINNTAISTNSTEEQETATDELEAITNHLIRQVGQNAIESE